MEHNRIYIAFFLFVAGGQKYINMQKKESEISLSLSLFANMYKAEYYPSSPTDTCSLSGSLPEMYASSYCSSSSSAPSTPEPEPEPIKVKKTSPKKQYQCTHCLKNFNRPSALQTHTYTHTAEKPFQCTK